MSELLKPCPFCGGAGDSWEANGDLTYARVGCKSCAVIFKEEKHSPRVLSFKDRRKYLIEQWNKREAKA